MRATIEWNSRWQGQNMRTLNPIVWLRWSCCHRANGAVLVTSSVSTWNMSFCCQLSRQVKLARSVSSLTLLFKAFFLFCHLILKILFLFLSLYRDEMVFSCLCSPKNCFCSRLGNLFLRHQNINTTWNSPGCEASVLFPTILQRSLFSSSKSAYSFESSRFLTSSLPVILSLTAWNGFSIAQKVRPQFTGRNHISKRVPPSNNNKWWSFGGSKQKRVHQTVPAFSTKASKN